MKTERILLGLTVINLILLLAQAIQAGPEARPRPLQYCARRLSSWWTDAAPCARR